MHFLIISLEMKSELCANYSKGIKKRKKKTFRSPTSQENYFESVERKSDDDIVYFLSLLFVPFPTLTPV